LVEGREEGGHHEGLVSGDETNRLFAASAVDEAIELDPLDFGVAKSLGAEKGALLDSVGKEMDTRGRDVEGIAEDEQAEDGEDDVEGPVIRMGADDQPGSGEGGEGDRDEQDDAADREGGAELHRPILKGGGT
jgi:hypothetical protein